MFAIVGYICLGHTYVRKCCPEGTLMNSTDEGLGCVPGLHQDPPGITLEFHKINSLMVPLGAEDDIFVDYKSGTLHYNNHSTKDFCVDMELNGNYSVFVLTEIPAEVFRYYSAGMFISVPFLVATFVATYFLDELKTFHGDCVKRNVVTLSFAYFWLALFQNIEPENGVLCHTVGWKKVLPYRAENPVHAHVVVERPPMT
ncbi:unnamed protein product [Nezara viridula]|uniref:Uncharacterized protein n=1 Tax=Nezara viridula TaxID=85310 RepID=A0A9P0HN40_NEZVI|nr:unnamed protein product [Nezara viridula]